MRSYGLNKIFVEGKSDKRFVEDLLYEHFGIDCEKLPKSEQLVVSTEGKDKLSVQPDLAAQPRKELQARNLVIFDADYTTKGGGPVRRRKEYTDLASELNVDLRIYLLPDDEQEGALEKLAETCFRTEFLFFKNCWEDMVNCFLNQDQLNLNVPGTKGLVHAYSDLFSKYTTAPNESRKPNFLDKGLWDLDTTKNPALQRLVTFIDQNLFDE